MTTEIQPFRRFQIAISDGISAARTPPSDVTPAFIWPAAGGEWVRTSEIDDVVQTLRNLRNTTPNAFYAVVDRFCREWSER